MNSNPGVIGRKVGMTQILEKKTAPWCMAPWSPRTCTSSASVLPRRIASGLTPSSACMGERKEKHTTKPLASFSKKAESESAPARDAGLRCTAAEAADREVGEKLETEERLFGRPVRRRAGHVQGKGFAGVMKRRFAGARNSDGTHEYLRHGGSIGTNMTPGRTLKGRGMPGQMGNKTISVLNQKLVKIIAEDNLLLVRGTIPGGDSGLVIVRGAIKKKNGGKVALEGVFRDRRAQLLDCAWRAGAPSAFVRPDGLLVVHNLRGHSHLRRRQEPASGLTVRLGDWLEAHGRSPRLGVHQRLDQETSGVLLLTTDPAQDEPVARAVEGRTRAHVSSHRARYSGCAH